MELSLIRRKLSPPPFNPLPISAISPVPWQPPDPKDAASCLLPPSVRHEPVLFLFSLEFHLMSFIQVGLTINNVHKQHAQGCGCLYEAFMLRPHNASKSPDCLDKQRSLSSSATSLLVVFFPLLFLQALWRKVCNEERLTDFSLVSVPFPVLCNHFWGHIVMKWNESKFNCATRTYCIRQELSDCCGNRSSFSSQKEDIRSLFSMYFCSIYDFTHFLSLRLHPLARCRDSRGG